MMKNKEYLTDFLSAGKYGVILSIAVSLLLLTGGFLFQGFSLPACVSSVESHCF